tara:strand:+ start:764 stop:1243 length:480 start_codon:yes stop_codon:yes gene_type:complete
MPKSKSNKKKRDPLRPKRPLTAFMRFSTFKRSELKKKHSDLSMTELSKLIGEAWRNASDEEKRPHQEQAAEDHEEYRVKMEKYKEMKPKRPRTAYAFYMKINRQSIANKYPDKNPRELMQYVAAAWKACGTTEKDKYIKMAAEDRQRWSEQKTSSTVTQ